MTKLRHTTCKQCSCYSAVLFFFKGQATWVQHTLESLSQSLFITRNGAQSPNVETFVIETPLTPPVSGRLVKTLPKVSNMKSRALGILELNLLLHWAQLPKVFKPKMAVKVFKI